MAPLAEAFIRLRPDTSRFKAEAEREIGTINVDVDLNTKDALLEIAALQKAVHGLGRSVDIDLDIDAAVGKIATLQTDLASLSGTSVTVDVDTATAQASLTAVQTAADALDGRTINVKVDLDGVAAAIADLATVQAAADALDRSTVSIRVNVNNTALSLRRLAAVTAAASAASALTVNIHVSVTGNLQALLAIATVASAARALGAMNPTVNIGTGGAHGGMRLLIAAIQIFGSVAVPIIATVAAGLASLAGMAIAAGAGIGVGILALSGVAGAVKALSAAHTEAAKSGAAMALQDRQLAAGAEQVRSAVASLANTRASAASATRRAAQQVADAERGLASAQREALRAQQDITRAREEAKDALEDLASQVKNNAIDIRQAVLDEAEARANLAKSSGGERVQAQITYDRARQHLDDLTVRQGRLREEQQASAKAGIEGSTQVRAATERAQQATERVAAAERALADARSAAAEQQRQAAFSIAQAQQAVAAAQRQVADATAAGSTAMETLRQKMDALSPTGRRFAEFLFGLKETFLDLRRAAETGMLTGLQAGIQAVLVFRAPLLDFIRRVAEGLGLIAQRALEALTSERWRPFFSFINSSAVPTMIELAKATGNIALAFANMIVAFAPMQRQMSGGLVDLTKRFADWSQTLQTNRSFQNFLDFVITRGPVVLATIGDLVDALVRIGIAAAPVGDVVLAAFRALAAVINAIPLGVLTVLVTAIAALKIAGMVVPALIALRAGIAAVASGAVTATAAMTNFKNFLGGPWMIAVTIAIAGLALLAAQSAKNKAEIDRLRTAYNSYANALKDGFTAETTANAAAILRQESGLRGLVSTMNQLNVSQETLVRGLNGDRDARNQVVDALNRQIAEEKRLQREARGSSDADTVASAAHKRRAEELERMRIAFAKTNTANREANDLSAMSINLSAQLISGMQIVSDTFLQAGTTADRYRSAIAALTTTSEKAAGKFVTLAALSAKIGESQLSAVEKSELFNSILRSIGDSITTSGPKFDALAGVFTAIATSSLSARDKVNLLKQAMDQMFGAAISQTEAVETLARTQQQLRVQLDSNKFGFDLNSASALKHRDAVLANRDALEAALLAAREKYLQDIANGVAESVARAEHEKTTKTILGQIDPLNRNSFAVQDLTNRYGAIPPFKKTEVTVPGLEKAIFEMVTAHAIQIGLSFGWNESQIASEIDFLTKMIAGKAGTVAMFKASGGLIPGFSPHPKADNIPAWLTAREFVQPVSAVDYYGVGVMEAMRLRKIPREAFGQYATGGFVGQRNYGDLTRWPVTMPVHAFMPVTVAELWRQWHAAQAASAGPGGAGPGFLPWPRSPGAQRGDTGVWRSILNFVRSSGIPYNFGNAYRPGDPLWHGSGRAIDFMGYNQDALAQLFMARQSSVLELIHRTNARDYGITRGQQRAFPTQWPLHRNHLHIAMGGGGLVDALLDARSFDTGGLWQPNTFGFNGSGGVETVRNQRQEGRLEALLMAVIEGQARIVAAIERVAPGVGRELHGTASGMWQAARAR